MFRLSREDLAYEKYMRFLNEADEMVQQQEQQSEAETAYQQGLDEIQRTIRETARKRYQKYKMDGGKDTFEMFKKNMENQLMDELEEDMKKQFGAVPGKETEKDFLRQIKMGIDQLNNNITMMMGGGQEQQVAPEEEQGQEAQQPEASPEEMQQAQTQEGQEQQVAPEEEQGQEAQQPMQETIDFLNDYYYEQVMNNLFDKYFG
jgi:hypothetical protein